MRTKSTLVVATVMLLGLSACGSDHTSHSEPATTMAAAGGADSTVAPAEFADADVAFAQGMIPHHEQAVAMSEMALDPTVGASAKVVDLATRIKGAQGPEIAQMTAWLNGWGMPMNTEMAGGHHMGSSDGMMSDEDMKALGGLTGTAFDKKWLEMMIEHHTGAITMSQAVIKDGSNADVLALAKQIITAQQTEIDEMKAQLAS